MLYDVMVIGGGPVGSRVADQLAGMGHQVVVLEQKQRLGAPVCCTGIISQECVSSFAIDESVILRRVSGARVFSPSGMVLSLRRQEPEICIVDRSAFNVALASRAQGKGVAYVLDSPVRSIEVREDRVCLEVSGQGGSSELFEGRVVVMATGFGSKLVEGLGLGRVGDFVMGAQAEVATNGLDEVEVYLGQEIAPAFFAWLVPTLPRRALVGLLSRRSPGLYLRKLMASLLAQGKISSAEAELSYGGIPLKPLARSYHHRVVVVGTAAGQVKPTTGGGIYYGLLCADILAHHLHQALASDTLTAKNLAGYEKEWQGKLGQELKIGYWARKSYGLMSDRQIDRIFEVIKANAIDDALLSAEDLSFDWHSRVLWRLMGHQALSKAIGMMKLPLPSKG